MIGILARVSLGLVLETIVAVAAGTAAVASIVVSHQRSRSEVDRAKYEAEKARAEAEKAKAEAEKAGANLVTLGGGT